MSPRELDRKRWRRTITAALADFPRQLEALRYSTQQFGEDFDAGTFAAAYGGHDLEAYSRVQAVERGVGRLQNYMADLAESSVKLADLDRRQHEGNEPHAAPFFEALRDDKAITAALCQRLIRSQRARVKLEHHYLTLDAADLHENVTLVLEIAPEFVGALADFIAPHLTS